jgi:hypothetical protein
MVALRRKLPSSVLVRVISELTYSLTRHICKRHKYVARFKRAQQRTGKVEETSIMHKWILKHIGILRPWRCFETIVKTAMEQLNLSSNCLWRYIIWTIADLDAVQSYFISYCWSNSICSLDRDGWLGVMNSNQHRNKKHICLKNTKSQIIYFKKKNPLLGKGFFWLFIYMNLAINY